MARKSRYIKKDVYDKLREKSGNKCSNYPGSNIIKDYKCPMWLLYNGEIDESGVETDHIDEFSITHNNDLDNLQLLCVCCHKVKTKLFMKNKGIFTSTEISNGACLMDVDEECCKKRRR